MNLKINKLLLLFSFSIVLLFLSSPFTALGTNSTISAFDSIEDNNFNDSLLLSISQDDEDDNDEDTEDQEDETDEENETTDENDDDNDDVDDDLEESNEREIQVEVDDNEAKIESELKNGDSKDVFHVELKTNDDGLEIQFEYSTETDSLETELAFKVEFYKLIEFIDIDNNSIFNTSVDEIKQEYSLDLFSPIVHTTESLDINTSAHIFEIYTTDGIFGAKIYIVEEFTKIDNSTIISPTQVKFDIIIKNFDYLSNDSYLALSTKLESSTEYEYDDETEDEVNSRAFNETSVKTTMNNLSGFFSWIETAIIDGVEIPVLSSPIHDDDDLEEDEQKLYLNYPHGTEIIHDPKIGVIGVLQEPIVNKIDVPGFSILPLFLALGAIIAIFKVKRVD